MMVGMRTATVDEAALAEREELLTTGEAARILNSSRQHVVDLCNKGDLPYTTVGRHRRIRRRDIEAVRSRTQGLTRDQRRSLWLNTAVAGKLVTKPRQVLATARTNLATLTARHPRGQAARWLEQWATLLDGPTERIVEVLTSPTPWAREMRQNSPFGGVLDDGERLEILSSFIEIERTTR